MRLTILLTLCVLHHTPAYPCAKEFEEFGKGQGQSNIDPKVEDLSAPGFFYYIRDRQNPQFYVDGAVGKDKVLRFTMDLKENDRQRSTALRGKDQFRRLMQFFKGRFDAVEGQWTQAKDDPLQDNLAAFNQAVQGGATPEAAARVTWTGQRSIEAGFTEVEILTLQGSPGQYSLVKVLFKRP